MILQSWLDLLCRMLPGVKRAIVVTDLSDPQNAVPEARWPDDRFDYPDLLNVLALSSARCAPLMCVESAAQSAGILAAHPLRVEGRTFGVLVVHVEAASSQQAVLRQLLDWGSAWLELLLRDGGRGTGTVAEPLSGVLNGVFEFSDLESATTAAATVLAREFDCEHVAIGLVQANAVRVCGISDATRFDARSDLVRRFEEAMEEAREQDRMLTDDPESEPGAKSCEAQKRLAEALGQGAILSLPLRNFGQTIGAVVFESAAGRDFEPGRREPIESIVKWLGPLLALKQRQARSLTEHLRDALQSRLDRLLEPGWHTAKIATLAVTGLIMVLAFSQGEYRIGAPASLEGRIQRAVVAPFDGYVAAAHARAGDTVKKGAVIASLEDRELKLEQRRWLSQKDELTKQYRKALSELNHAQAKILKAQIAQADAQLALVEQKFQRTRLTAPLDGIILAGDLSRSLGAPVERGEVLFEIAPLDQYRLVLRIDAREIADVRTGQRGVLTLSSLPDQELSFVVERLSPVFQEEEGTISYRTEARIEGATGALRPGMEGLGKISIERRSYGWILFHSMVDWLRLKAWAWLP